MAQEAKGNREEAIRSYKEAIRLNPQCIEAYIGLGNVQYVTGNFEDAISLYKEAIKLEANYSIAHNNLGMAQEGKKDFRAAVASYEKAIRLNPQYIEAHKNLGDAQEAVGNLEAAIKSYEEAIRLEPKYSAAKAALDNAQKAKKLFDSGNAQKDAGKLEDAIKSYEEAIRLEPKYSTAKTALETAKQAKAHFDSGTKQKDAGRLDDAIEKLNYSLKLVPDNVNALNVLGNTYLAKNDIDLAISCFNRAEAIKPKSSEMTDNSFKAYMRTFSTGHNKKAIDQIHKRAASPKEAGDILMRIGDTLLQYDKIKDCSIGVYKLAIEEYKRMPNDPQARLGLCACYTKIGDYHMKKGDVNWAIREYTNALITIPRFPGAFSGLEAAQKVKAGAKQYLNFSLQRLR